MALKSRSERPHCCPGSKEWQGIAILPRKQIESLGYRVGVGEYEGVWITTATHKTTGEFHRVKLLSEDEAVAELARSVGIELKDC